MDLLLTSIVGLLLVLELPVLIAQTVVLTSNPSRTVFCDRTEVIFTCETRGSDTLTWISDGSYVRENISFGAQVDGVNTTLSTIATLTRNDMDGGVRVLESTLRILTVLAAPSGFVMCAVPSGTEKQLGFNVIDRPVIPPVIVTFQLELGKDMCSIASVLQSPTNRAEAAVTNYTVIVDGASVGHENASFISTDRMRHSALLYNSSCGGHRISISASNMCGDSPGADEIVLNSEQRFMLVPNGANSVELGSVTVVVTMAVLMVTFKWLFDLV